MDYLKIEVQLIDGDEVLTGIVLETTSQETLSEEELIHLIERRDSSVDPVLEEFKSLLQVLDITTKGFQ